MESSTYFPLVSSQMVQFRSKVVTYAYHIGAEVHKAYQQRPILTILLALSSFWPLAIYTGVSVSLLAIGLTILAGIAGFFALVVFCFFCDFVLIAALCIGYLIFLLFGCSLGLRSLQLTTSVMNHFRSAPNCPPADKHVQNGVKPMKTVKTL